MDLVPNRSIQPAMPPAAYKTYRLSAPLSTHWGPARCEDVACPNYLHGWMTLLDESTNQGQGLAHLVRHDRSRRHVESRRADGMTVFTFEAGQQCFEPHRKKTGRPPRLLVAGGDFRGNPRQIPVFEHVRADDWVEDFALHQDRLATRLAQG